MAFFNWTRWLRSLSRHQIKTYRKSATAIPLGLESLEDRTVLSVLPTAVVTNPTTLTAGFSPSIAQDPINPLKLVEVQTTGSVLTGQYSVDGGNTWINFTSVQNITDPTTKNPYTTVTNPTVVMDRAENVYITDIERNSVLNTSGALVFQRFLFTKNSAPTVVASESNKIIQEWVGSDPIENPVVAVDSNLPSFKDPTTGKVQTDTMATLVKPAGDPNSNGVNKSLYVAWNTSNKTPNSPVKPAFNTNIIMVAGSGDGGKNFTAPQIVNDNGNIESNSATSDNAATPHIVFTQGTADGAVAGGQLVFVWDNIAGGIQVDSSQPDGGKAANNAAASVTVGGSTVGTVLDGAIQVDSYTITNGGSGYSVGDVVALNLSGGTLAPGYSGSGAQFVVSSVSGTGVVTSLALLDPGAYLKKPSSVSLSTIFSSFGTFGANLALDLNWIPSDPGTTIGSFSDGAVQVAKVNITAGGSGYSMGDTFTLAGGVFAPSYTGFGATVEVTSVTTSGTGANTVFGIINGIAIIDPGAYLLKPNAINFFGGSGTKATFSVNWGGASGSTIAPDIAETTTYTTNVTSFPTNFIANDIQVTLNLFNPNDSHLQVVLETPKGVMIPLVENQIDGNAKSLPSPGAGLTAGISGNNLGEITVGTAPNQSIVQIGTVFDDNGPRAINDSSFTNSQYTAIFTPEGGSTLDQFGVTTGNPTATAADIGTWKLLVTDVRNDGGSVNSDGSYTLVNQSLDSWSLHFSQISTTHFGQDKSVDGAVPLPGAANATTPYSQANVGPFGPAGVGPNISVAIDNSLGSFSPYEGRIYIAYTGVVLAYKGDPGLNTNVYLISSDTVGTSWNFPVQVNDDSVNDNFSQGNRPQFMPTVAVDNVTGTVGVMYYDGRWDSAVYTGQSRAANSFSDSIDGGQTFSISTTFNTEQTAIDAITGKTVNIQPVPGNQSVANATFGFGDSQGLIMNAGHVIPVFSSNNNAAGSFVDTATVTIAAGPRIITGDMGPIVNNFFANGTIYNNIFAPDGTRELQAFMVQFDRPVDPNSFTGDDVTLQYRDSVTPLSDPASLILTGAANFTIVPLDLGSVGRSGFGLATTFLVELNTPLSGVGTYSYAIGPMIQDNIRSVSGGKTKTGNWMDQNQDTVTGQQPVLNSNSGDVFAVPTPTNGAPFQLPYSQDTLPLIIPGPYFNSSSVAFNPKAGTGSSDNLILNGTNNGIDVAFDRDIQASTFTAGNILRINSPVGPITPYTLGPAVTFVGGGGSGAAGFATIIGGTLSGVTITNPGSGYTTVPTVVFNGGGGTLAAGLATINGGMVTAVSLTNVGQGYSSTAPQTIPDGGILNVPITIADSLQVNDLTVGLNITHAQVSDLSVYLIAPDGTQVQLLAGGTGANLTNAIFDDNATTSITTGTGPYTGIYKPEPGVTKAVILGGGTGYQVNDLLTVNGGAFAVPAQLKVTAVSSTGAITAVSIVSAGSYAVPPYNPVTTTDVTTPGAAGATFSLAYSGLSAFNGKNYLGTWTLRVVDNAANGVAGTLNGWTINPVSVTPNPSVLSSTSLVSGGSGYKVNDILTLQGGTATVPGQLLVTSVDVNGAITSTSVYQPGLYSTTPGFGATAFGGSGTGATFTGSFQNDGTPNRTFRITIPTQTLSGTYSIVFGQDSNGNYIEDTALNSATVVSGGTGYAVGDQLTVVGGVGTSAVLQVAAIDASGAITRVELVSPGSYSTNPTSPVTVTDSTTLSASGATLALVFGNRVNTSLNAGLPLLEGGTLTGGSLNATSYPSGTLNTSIPPSGTIDSAINVSDSYLVQGLTVQLSIQHPNDPDLTATLISPNGTQAILFSGVGLTGSTPHANFTNTTLDDTASLPIEQAATQPGIGIGAGPFNPQQSLTTAFKNTNSQGNWILRITSNSSTLQGTLVNWTLKLKNDVLGGSNTVADQFTSSFRIFVQDPTNPVAQQSWTAVGPASIMNGADSGRIGGLAVDPSDPSGNTVYTAGASGGVWKTNNFLTTDPNGPTWIPLTNLGPANSLNVGSIAVFGRNNDPNQSIIFVATGEGSTFTSGVGFLRSMDGGRTWNLLDSLDNTDGTGNISSISNPNRNHQFVGSTSFQVIVDPTAEPNGDVIVYAALGGNNGGIYRSIDTGKHWTLLQSGTASSVQLSAGSADNNGNLQILYAAIEGQGVYFTINASTANALVLRAGGQGNAIRRNVDKTPDTAIPITTDTTSPLDGGNGRIVLAVPALTGNSLEDTLHEGWVYAVVNTSGGVFGGLFVSKDFGANWTKIRLPVTTNEPATPTNPKPSPVSTNNYSLTADFSVDGNGQFAQANYDVSLAVDPNNPNILYIGGTNDAQPQLNYQAGGGFIRVDTSTIVDPYAEIAYNNSNNDGDLTQFSTQGAVTVTKPGKPYGMVDETGSAYLNMLRDPNSPFLTPSSLRFTNISSFGNSGYGATYGPFTGGGLDGTDQHQLVAIIDPQTGLTRLIFGDDQGIWTGTDNGTGNPIGNIGAATSVVGSRNGNLQITQFYDGTTQPSTLAADISGALFYGVAQDDGYPVSDNHILDNGNISWSGGSGEGDASGVKADQSGTGSVYYYKWPCCGGSNPLPTDFFTAIPGGGSEVSRTTGLIQAGDNPGGTPPTGQWPFLGGSKFALNPIDPTAIVMSSSKGRVFLTAGPSLGDGKLWFPIAEPSDLDSSYAPAVAFGAPANSSAALDNFIYVGTTNGHIFVTTTGGGDGLGSKVWTNISNGLDGSSVEFIVTNPTRGSHEAYAVTTSGVYYIQDSLATGAKWINITGNLFRNSRALFNDPKQILNPASAGQTNITLSNLTSIQADYRYAIPDDLTKPNGPTHPVLYVGGQGGVFRSLDKGVTWTYFPDQTIDGAVEEGGFFPSTQVNDLTLSLGNINPLNGSPSQPYGRNMLVASTYGQGDYAIRLDDQIVVPGGKPLYTYAVNPVEGPHVVSVSGVVDADGTSMDGIVVTFSGPVDPATFTPAKVNSVTDVNGNPIIVSSILDMVATNHNQYEIVFASPVAGFGFYNVSIGPKISDYSGNQMDQNQNFANGELPGDIYSARFLFQPFTNQAPLLNVSSATVTPSVNEDQTANMIPGTTVNDFVNNLTPAPGITDPDNFSFPGYQLNTPSTTAPVGIAVTSVDNTNGDWQYSLDNGTTWLDIGSPTASAALLLEANSNGNASPDRIRFIPDTAYYGTATFTFRAWDLTSGLSVYGKDGTIGDTTNNGGSTAYSTNVATATITVNFVNHSPVGTSNTVSTPEGIPYKFAVADFGFSDPNDNPANNFLAVEITTLPTSGILTDNGTVVTAGQFIPVTDLTAGNLVFQSTTYYYQPFPTFTFQVQDDGGTANGGVDTDPNPKTMTIDLTYVNHAPIGTSNTVTTAEDTPYTFKANDFGFSDPKDVPANNFKAVEFTTLPAKGSLTDNGIAVTAGQFIPVADLNSGKLVFTPVTTYYASPYTAFTFQVQDDGGTANKGVDTDPNAKTMTINVTFVNHAPVGTSNTVTTPEGIPYAFKGADFGFTDPNDNPANNFKAVEITTLPTSGTLTDNGKAVTAGQFIPVADLTAGNLVFQSTTHYYQPFPTFTFQVQDDGGTANGGHDTDPTPKTMTIKLTYVDHAPIGTSNTVTTLEDTAYAFKANDFGFTDPNDVPANNFKAVEITTLPTLGSLTDNGIAVTAGQFIPVGDLTGRLVFTPASTYYASPYTSFTFQVQDDGGTANKGVDTDPTAKTMTINVIFLNHAPLGTANTVTTSDSMPYIFQVADFGFSDLNDNPSNNLKAVEITTLPGTGTLKDNGTAITATQHVSVADITNGKLIFTPVTLTTGNPYTSFTFQVQDDGGTANSGHDTDPTARKMTIIVTPFLTSLTSLTASPSSTTLVGSPVTISGSVVANTTLPNIIPTGTVTAAYQNATASGSLGSATLTATGGFTFKAFSALPAGSNVITVTYAGNANFTGNTGTLTQTVNLYQTSISSVSVAPNLSLIGSPVTITGKVIDTTLATNLPTGSVTATASNGTTTVSLGSATLTAGAFTFSNVKNLPAGADTITVNYATNATFASSTGSTTTTVVNDLTTTVITPGSQSVPYGTASLTATVTKTNAADHFPATTLAGVSFTLVSGTTTVVIPANDGRITYTTSGNTLLASLTISSSNPLIVGTYTVTASYAGEMTTAPYFGPSVSTAASLVVTQAKLTKMTLSALSGQPSTSYTGQSLTFISVVTKPAGSPNFTGAVKFSDGTSALPASLVTSVISGNTLTATLVIPATGANAFGIGKHNLSALYTGDQGFSNISAQQNLTQIVLNGNPEDHLKATAPSQVTYGAAFSLSISALDQNNVGTPLAAGDHISVSILSTTTPGGTLGGTTSGVLDANGQLNLNLTVNNQINPVDTFTLLITDTTTGKTTTVTFLAKAKIRR